MRRISAFFIVALLLFSCTSPASAHSGRTDSQGGHRDNKNKSGLGSYHYHHGYSAHLHPGGICPYAPKDSITISNQPQSIDVGDSLALEWSVTYYSGSSAVSWSSSAPEIIDVTNGQLTAKAPGKATITATLNNGSKSFTVSSKEVLPSDLVITNIPERLELTKSASLSATLTPSNVTNKDLAWASSDESIAAVSQSGTVSAISPGRAVITVSSASGLSRSFEVEIFEVYPESIAVSSVSLELVLDACAPITASVVPSDTTNKAVLWASSDPNVASVDQDGNVTANGVGRAVITASCQEVSTEVPVEVHYIRAEALAFDESTLPTRLNLEETAAPVVLFQPKNATYQDVVLTSSDSSILEISGDTVKAVGVGTATITASSKDSSVSTEIRVNPQGNAWLLLGLVAIPWIILLVAVNKHGSDRRKQQATHPRQSGVGALKDWHYRK